MSKRSLSESLMGMDDGTWERHANPWSGWTRVAILPILTLCIWSRVWIGWWCIVPIALTLFWTWWNPRAFSKPVSTDNWMSKGVLGERIWLNRKSIPIPARHARMAHILLASSFIGLFPFIWGLYKIDVWATAAGLALVMGSKLWFLDRMVWLLEETQDEKSAVDN